MGQACLKCNNGYTSYSELLGSCQMVQMGFDIIIFFHVVFFLEISCLINFLPNHNNTRFLLEEAYHAGQEVMGQGHKRLGGSALLSIYFGVLAEIALWRPAREIYG